MVVRVVVTRVVGGVPVRVVVGEIPQEEEGASPWSSGQRGQRVKGAGLHREKTIKLIIIVIIIDYEKGKNV